MNGDLEGSKHSCRSVAASFVRRIVPLLLLLVHGGICQADDRVVLSFYDIGDLIHPRPDFPAPRLGLQGIEEEQSNIVPEEPPRTNWTAEEIVELIKKTITPEVWGKDGNAIYHRGSTLIVRTVPETQVGVQGYLATLRDEARLLYQIECRFLAMDAATIASFGFETGGSAPALILPTAKTERRIADLLADGTIESVTTPRLSVFENQRSHFLIADQSAYISELRVDEATGIADPQIDVLNEGLALEVVARRHSFGSPTRLEWSITIANAVHPHRSAAAGENCTIELPEITKLCREGRTLLESRQILAVRGFPHLNAADDREMVLFLSCKRTRAY